MSAEKSIFDKRAAPGKGFYFEDGRIFYTIRELEEALLKCSSIDCKKMFDRYTAGYKNDFAAWIGDVFELGELAGRIFPIRNPVELSNELKKYEMEINGNSKVDEKNPVVEKKQETNKQEVHEKEKTEQKTEPVTIKVEQKVEIAPNEKGSKANSEQQGQMESVKKDVADRADRADQTFDRVKKIKQHSFYNKANFEDTLEDIKNRYEDLSHVISEQRRAGKDMSIPAMMIRNIYPKIVYFQVSQNKLDHDAVVELLDEIEQEIKYAESIKPKNLKEEVMEALGFSTKKEE